MSTFVAMKVLESAPWRYDAGMRILSLGRADAIYASVAEAAVPRPGLRVLELGCGTGSLTLAMARRAARVVAVDQSAGMLEVAEHRLRGIDGVELIEMTAVDVGRRLAARRFDVAVASLAMSELSVPEQDLLLLALRDRLVPGGRIVVADEVPGGHLLRWPLALLTWVLTQTTTRALRRFDHRLAGAGYRGIAVTPLGAGMALFQAEPAEGEPSVPAAVPLLPLPRGSHALAEVVHAGLRFFPVPVRPGLRALGRPGPDSPVVLTGNYDLTVRRVARALEGLDAWLLVADSHGVNVWCGASGGHLTTHQVVAALLSSGLEPGRVLLPQLAATGVEREAVQARTGWRARFGPADCRDLAGYLRGERTPTQHRVRWGAVQRLEMAAAWAFPMSLVAGLVAWGHRLGAVVLVWAAALAVFFLADRVPARWRIPATVTGIALGAAVMGSGLWGALGWALAGAMVGGVLVADTGGSTPVEVAGMLEDRAHTVALDPERCRGDWICEGVCPEGVFARGESRVEQARPEACIRCGACIVQCPHDALAFRRADGAAIPPELTRRHKLNLLGKRR